MWRNVSRKTGIRQCRVIAPYSDLRWRNLDWMDAHTVPGPACICLYCPVKYCITKHQLWGYHCPSLLLQESCSDWYRSSGYKLIVSKAKNFLWHMKSALVYGKTFPFRVLCWLGHWDVSASFNIILSAGTSLAPSLSSQFSWWGLKGQGRSLQ